MHSTSQNNRIVFKDSLQLPDIETKLWGLIRQVPPGRVTTCGALAKVLGGHTASRWIGYVMRHHEHRGDCPCHRVVRAEGVVGGYVIDRPEQEKTRRLCDEGVQVADDRVDLDQYGFTAFDTDYPLKMLADMQHRMAGQVKITRRWRLPKLIAGLDVSYPHPGRGVAAYALFDTTTDQLAWLHTIQREVRFPYITGFLTFREVPMYLELLDEVDRLQGIAPLLLTDGSGILHPRRFGVACHLGVLTGLPTIGVTKKLLCGRILQEKQKQMPHGGHKYPGQPTAQVTPIELDDKVQGYVVKPSETSSHQLYVSPGHRTDPTFSLKAVLQTLSSHRLPEPIYWADHLSRQVGRQMKSKSLEQRTKF